MPSRTRTKGTPHELALHWYDGTGAMHYEALTPELGHAFRVKQSYRHVRSVTP